MLSETTWREMVEEVTKPGRPDNCTARSVFHFTIAFGAAAVYYLLRSRLPLLARAPVLRGALYGVGVFLFMHDGVVPLSAAPKQPPASLEFHANLVSSRVFFVGIPIALVVRKAGKETSARVNVR